MAQDPYQLLADETDPFETLASATDPTLGETVSESAQAFVGGAMSMAGEAVRGLGTLADQIRAVAPALTALDVGSGPSALTVGGEAITGMAPDVDPRVAASMPGKIAGGLGQVVGLMGATAVNPILGGEAAFLSSVSDTERELSMAQSDLDGGTKLGAMMAGGAVGILDMVPVNRVLSRINKVAGGVPGLALEQVDTLKRIMADAPTAARMAQQIGTTGALEAGTEAAQRALTNAIVDYATDQELDILRGTADEAAVGGSVGSLLQAVVEMATRKRRIHDARAAQMNLPAAEYRLRMETDPVFRQTEQMAVEATIAEQLGEKINAEVAEIDPTLFDTEGTTSIYDPVDGQRFLVGTKPEPGPRVRQQRGRGTPLPDDYSSAPYVAQPAPGGLSEEEVAIWNAREAQKVDAALQSEQAGFQPTPASDYRTIGSPEGSQAPQPDAARSTTQPRPVGFNVQAGPSSAAYTPVPNQFNPLGRPAVLIDGSAPTVPWGGSRENTIGAKASTSLDDVVRPLLELVQSRGERVQRRPGMAGNILGYYDAGGLIAANYRDVQTIAHEVGHMIHRDVMAGQQSKAVASANPDAVLNQLPPQVQGQVRSLAYAGVQPSRQLSEGFAEGFRMWVTSPEELATRAPEASRWLSNWVVSQPANVRAALTNAQTRAQNYRWQGDLLRSPVQPPPSLSQRIANTLRGLPEKFVREIYDDSLILNKVKPGLSDFWRSIRGSSRGLTAAFYDGTPVDLNNNAIPGAKNFKQVVAPLKHSEIELFDRYIMALRTLALERKGVDAGGTPAEARRVVDELNATKPHFRTVADDLTRWWASVNSVLAQASPTYAANLARIAADDAAYGIDFYAPLHRWISSEGGRSWTRASAKNRALVDDVSRKQSGSTLAVKSPLEAFVNEARVRFDQAVYRNLVEKLVEAFDAMGGNDGPLKPLISEDQGVESFAGTMPSRPEDSPDSIFDALRQPELMGEMIPVRLRDASGKERVLKIDRRLAELAANVDPATLRQGLGVWSAVLKLGGIQRRLLSTSQVVLNPGFQYITNLMLDVPSTYLYSQYFKPHELGTLLGYTARNVLMNGLGTYKPWRSDWVKTYENLGLHGSIGLAGENRVGRTVRTSIGRRHTAESIWESLTAFLAIPQRAVQMANMQKAAKVQGIDITQPLTAEEANTLRLAARIIDYNAGGNLSRQAQVFIPFLRPFFESQRNVPVALKRNPVEFICKAGVLMGTYTALRYMLADDEFEKNKTASDALRSVTIPVKVPDGLAGTEREFGVELRVESTMAPLVLLPVMIVESMRAEGQDPTDFVKAIAGTFVPPHSIPAFDMVMQQVSNRVNPLTGMFSDADGATLVPKALQDRAGIAQQTPSTAPVAVAAAQVMDGILSGLPQSSVLRQNFASPVRWEAALRSLAGGNGLAMAEGWGIIPGLRTQAEAEGADVLPGALRRGGLTNWNDRNIRSIYELDHAGTVAEATRDRLFREDPQAQRLRTSIRDVASVLSTMRYLSTYDTDSLTVQARRDIAKQAQSIAKEVVREVQAGKIPTAHLKAQAQYKVQRKLHDIDRGAFYR